MSHSPSPLSASSKAQFLPVSSGRGPQKKCFVVGTSPLHLHMFDLKRAQITALSWLSFFSLLTESARAELGVKEEEIAAQVSAFWKEWAHVWDGTIEDHELAESLAENASLHLDGPDSMSAVLSGPFQLTSRKLAKKPTQGRNAVLREFRDWPSKWSGGSVKQSKFKVVEVEISGNEVVTNELVAVVVEGDKIWEYNGRWKTHWVIGKEKLLFDHSEILEGEVAQTNHFIFKETTTGLLPKGSTADLELIEENFYWRERIPASFEPDQFGETGISIADVNGDGLEDVYLCQIGGLRNKLWLRTKEGRLITAPSSGLEIRDNTAAALFLDFDSDGDRDAILTTTAGIVVFANDGEGVFREHVRFPDLPYGFGMGACDYDQDGDLDVFVCQYYSKRNLEGETLRGSFPVPFPIQNATNGGPNVLLRNDGGLQFVDASQEAGLANDNSRYSFACLWEDFDNDGDQDLIVANDFGPNNFYSNNGKGGFVDHSDAPGIKDGGFGMGLTAADFDLDGLYDLHISNMYSGAGNRIARQKWFHADKDEKTRKTLLNLARGNTLLKNLGESIFSDVSVLSGISMGRWSWASLAVDLNNDTREDLLVANGFVTGKDPDDL